jgi:hypothetical protein
MKKPTAEDIRKFYKESFDERGVGIPLTECKKILEKQYFDWYIKECESLIRDLLLLPTVACFDCYGCKYDEWADCREKCQLVARAEELGFDIPEDDD